MEKKKTNKKFTYILIGFVTLGVIYGGYKYIHSLSHETTDDAQVEQNMTPIIPRVTGFIEKIYVKDNQFVKKGDTLFVIDNSDYIVKVEEAKAALLAAESSFEVSKADVGTAQVGVSVSDANAKSATTSIESAKIKLWRATNDFERFENLYKNKSITKQQYEQALAAKQEAENQLQMMKQQKNASDFQKNVAVTRTNVSQKTNISSSCKYRKSKSNFKCCNVKFKIHCSYSSL